MEWSSGYLIKQTSDYETNCMNGMSPILLKKKKNIYVYLYVRVLKNRPQKYTPTSYLWEKG